MALSGNLELRVKAVPLNESASPLASADSVATNHTVFSIAFVPDSKVPNPATGDEDYDAKDNFEFFTMARNDASNSTGRRTEIIAGSASAFAATGALIGLVLFPVLRYLWRRQRGSYSMDPSLDPSPSTRRLAGFSGLFRRNRKEPEAIPILERYQKDIPLEQTSELTS